MTKPPTIIAGYAQAGEVTVSARVIDTELNLRIADDGIGGAGTRLSVTIPLPTGG